MRKLTDHCTAILSRMIFIGFGIQIVLGMIWMGNAFANLEGFGEGIVCVGKILLFLCAIFCFLRTLPGVGRGSAALGSLAVALFPMVLQCHFAAGIQSVMASALLLGSAGILRALRPSGRRGLLLLWIPVVVFAVIVPVTAGGRSGKGGSVLERCASRFAWTNLMENYESMPEEWQGMVDGFQVRESSYEAAGMERILFPYLKETLGEEQAEEFLKELIRTAWRRDRAQITKEIVWDLAGYTLAPPVLQLQLRGRAYSSYSGANYRQVLLPAPVIGKAYMDYGCWWFQVALVTGIILWIVKFARGYRAADKGGWLLIALTCCCIALLYTMSGAGKMDYLNVTFILCMWLAGILGAALPSNGSIRPERETE